MQTKYLIKLSRMLKCFVDMQDAMLRIVGKMVKFGSRDYYAEETPLMFSRCSSLGSLSGFEQHSIHDDHSSVISDFRLYNELKFTGDNSPKI